MTGWIGSNAAGDAAHLAYPLSTSLRTRAPEDTRRMARRCMAALGITACHDATAHDVLGVPVWFSHRPGGLAGAVHAGKGLHAVEAEVGALMEAVEFAVAELADQRQPNAQQPLGRVMDTLGAGLTIADLAPRFGAAVSPSNAVSVDDCEDVGSGTVVQLPSELLRLIVPDDGAKRLFDSTSNGLASGNSLDEATLHGLLEVLERDCIAMDFAAPSTISIALASLPDPWPAWSSHWLLLGVRLRLRQLANPFELPCFEATLDDDASSRAPRALGFGLHPHARVAMNRAITEAAQSRLHALHIAKPVQAATAATAATAARRIQPSCAEASTIEVSFADVPGLHVGTATDALNAVMARVQAAGMQRVLRRRLDAETNASALDGLHVVKVVVPGCECAVRGPLRIGRRLAHRLVQAA